MSEDQPAAAPKPHAHVDREIAKLVISKVVSGRFIMTCAFSAAFCIGFLNGVVPADAFAPIVLIVARDYFDRKDRNEPPKPS